MAFLNAASEARQIEWARKHFWDIRFEGAPAPFNDWFPATDIDVGQFNLESNIITAFNAAHRIPRGHTALELRATFYDDDQGTLRRWLREWANGVILGGTEQFGEREPFPGEYVAALETAVRRVDVLMLNIRRQVVEANSYLVYPEGNLSFNGASDSAPQQYSASFVIAGR